VSQIKHWEVRAAHTQQAVLDGQCDVVDICYSAMEAKQRAQYVLTDEYQRMGEMSEPLRYSQVVRVQDGGVEVVTVDFFRKEAK
jgi:hypothetical protein